VQKRKDVRFGVNSLIFRYSIFKVYGTASNTSNQQRIKKIPNHVIKMSLDKDVSGFILKQHITPIGFFIR